MISAPNIALILKIKSGQLQALDASELDLRGNNNPILDALREHFPASFSSIEIDIGRYGTEELQNFIAFVNALPIPSSVCFGLCIRNTGADRVQKLIAMMGLLHTKLKSNLLSYIDLSDLKKIEVEEFILIMDSLCKLKNIKRINLGGNGLFELDLKVLQSVLQRVRESGQSVSLWHHYELSVVKEWPLERRLAFARVYMEAVALSNSFEMGPLPFALEENQYFSLFSYYVGLNPKITKPLEGWIKNHIEKYELRLELAKKHLKIDPFIAGYQLAEYGLREEDCLELSLLAMRNNPDFSFSDANLGKTNLPAGLLIKSVEPLVSFYDSDDEEEEQGEEPEASIEIVKDKVMEEFTESCKILWKEDYAFLQPCLNKLRAFKIEGDYDILKFWNMIKWLTWAATVMARNQQTLRTALVSEFGGDGETANGVTDVIFSYIGQPTFLQRALLEILNFSDPALRYRLGATLLDKIFWSDVTTAQYADHLYPKNRVWSILPSISLFGNGFSPQAKEDFDRKGESENWLVQAEAILSALPASIYKEGSSQRSLIAAIQALEHANEFNVSEKLDLLMGPLKGSLRLDTDKLLKEFFDAFKIKEKLERSKALRDVYGRLIEKFGGNVVKRLSLDKYLEEGFEFSDKDRNRQINRAARKVKEELEGILRENEWRAQKSYWLLIQGLGALSELNRLKGLPFDQCQQITSNVFAKLFGLEEGSMEYYPKTLLGLRNESALLTYLGKIRRLPSTDREPMERIYRTFVQTVLSPGSVDFYERRYSKQLSSHLATVFSGRDSLMSLWKMGWEEDFSSFLDKHRIVEKVSQINYKTYLYNKIFQHQHLDPRGYSKLREYLEVEKNCNDKKEQEAIKTGIKADLEAAYAGLKVQKKLEGLELVRFTQISVQRFLINLIETSLEDKNTQLKLLTAVLSQLKKLRGNTEFEADLRALIETLKFKKSKQNTVDFTGWKIIDTDHYWHLFMSGTDVQTSCQRVEGDPKLNKCLLAYVVDGKNRMLAILDANNTIVARCIFRILWDAENHCPVLYMEKIYPEFLSPRLEAALEAFARLRAQALNLTLVYAASTEESFQYPNSIESLSSPAAWEYVDALYNFNAGGVFAIPRSQILLDSNLKMRGVLQPFFETNVALSERITRVIADYCMDSVEHERGLQPEVRAVRSTLLLPLFQRHSQSDKGRREPENRVRILESILEYCDEVEESGERMVLV